MKNTFLQNIASALRSAGGLMVGTGVMIWMFNGMSTLAESMSHYATLFIVVGGCFVLIGIFISFILKKKSESFFEHF